MLRNATFYNLADAYTILCSNFLYALNINLTFST